MAPHPMDTILHPSHWPESLSDFVTWCLKWDPKSRPTSTQALSHEYFTDAVDPLRPKSSTSRLLGRKQSDKSFKSLSRDSNDFPTLASKASWFRRSLIGKSDSPVAAPDVERPARKPLVSHRTLPENGKENGHKTKHSIKRATWASGAPMPILPSIRPVSPLSNAVTAQASSTLNKDNEKATKKIGRQLSLNSRGNHYADVHRQEAERALDGTGSNVSSVKESFFSHLRKRARRLSGRSQAAAANNDDDEDTSAGCMPWSNRSSLVLDTTCAGLGDSKHHSDTSELDTALQNVKYALDTSTPSNVPVQLASPAETPYKRSTMPPGSIRSVSDGPYPMNSSNGIVPGRTRRAMQMANHPVHRYETPEEEDELLDEALHSANKAARSLAAQAYFVDDGTANYSHQPMMGNNGGQPLPSPYPTPSPSGKCENVFFGQNDDSPSRRDFESKLHNGSLNRQWPTPPYEEDEWTNSNSGMLAAGPTYR